MGTDGTSAEGQLCAESFAPAQPPSEVGAAIVPVTGEPEKAHRGERVVLDHAQ